MTSILLYVYVPESHLDQVKQAIFDAGGGQQGDYEACCWQVKGQGPFRPIKGAQPYLGHVSQLEYVDEYKLEVLCPLELKHKIVPALKEAHPY